MPSRPKWCRRGSSCRHHGHTASSCSTESMQCRFALE
jgi:hypothetical protein